MDDVVFVSSETKFGDHNKDSEVFVVAPSTAPLNPVLLASQVRLKKFLNKGLCVVPCTMHNTLVFRLVLLIKSLHLQKIYIVL